MAPFAFPHPCDRFLIARVARQMKTTQALNGDDRAPLEQGAGSIDVVDAPQRDRNTAVVVKALKPDMRPAFRAGRRLSMKASILRGVVFLSAVAAQGELGHARVGAVVGDRPKDGKSRTAVSAIGEGIAMAPVSRFRDFSETARAGRGIWNDAGLHNAPATWNDMKCRIERMVFQ